MSKLDQLVKLKLFVCLSLCLGLTSCNYFGDVPKIPNSEKQKTKQPTNQTKPNQQTNSNTNSLPPNSTLPPISIQPAFNSPFALPSFNQPNQTGNSSGASPWKADLCSVWTDSSNGNRFDYCVKISEYGTNPAKTLYAFHGMGGGAKGVCDRIGGHAQNFNITDSISHIVCPSFGPSWSISEKGRTESFSRFRTFIQQQYGATTSEKPVLYGESMGGFNALKASGSVNPTSLEFQKVAVVCPAIFSKRLQSKAIAKTIPSAVSAAFPGADVDTAVSIVQDSPYFDGMVSYPELLMMANRNDFIRVSIPQLGLDLGGIFEGAKDFYSILRSRGQDVQMQEIPGGHCQNIPVDQVVDFLRR